MYVSFSANFYIRYCAFVLLIIFTVFFGHGQGCDQSVIDRVLHTRARISTGIRRKLADSDRNESDLAGYESDADARGCGCGSDADIHGSGSTVLPRWPLNVCDRTV